VPTLRAAAKGGRGGAWGEASSKKANIATMLAASLLRSDRTTSLYAVTAFAIMEVIVQGTYAYIVVMW
jgi:hypothetical protein